jgi:hypothetical protein
MAVCVLIQGDLLEFLFSCFLSQFKIDCYLLDDSFDEFLKIKGNPKVVW